MPSQHPDLPAALGALLRLDAHLGSHHADRFTEPDGPWDQWVNALAHLRAHPSYTPAEQHCWTDLHCDFAHGWTRPRSCHSRSRRPDRGRPGHSKERTGNNGARKRQRATPPNPDSPGVPHAKLALGCEAKRRRHSGC
ncbi:DUF6000 family protein [Streptomyces sp. NPDC025273]|uniref:DUF6000 family protein n=1 Tax=unclassified Streptomyces TaxID=2593676 RepID=UPI0033DC5D9F